MRGAFAARAYQQYYYAPLSAFEDRSTGRFVGMLGRAAWVKQGLDALGQIPLNVVHARGRTSRVVTCSIKQVNTRLRNSAPSMSTRMRITLHRALTPVGACADSLQVLWRYRRGQNDQISREPKYAL
jgi:hypothetical protein